MAPAVRVRADTVLTRSPAGTLAQFRSRPSASFVAPTFADAQTGTLVFGGVVGFEQIGSTTVPVQHGRLLPLTRGVRDVLAMRRYTPAGSFTAPLFADAQTGSLIFGGSSTEAKTGSDSPTGTVIFGGLVPFEQVGATTIPLAHGRLLPLARGVRDIPAMRRYATSGSFVAPVFADVQTGTLTWGGSGVEGKTGSNSSTGTLTFTGTVAETNTRIATWVQVGAFVRVS